MSSSSHPIPVEQTQRPYFVGVDVGGTNTKIGLVDDRGRTLGFASIPTDPDRHGPDDAIPRIRGTIEGLLEPHGLDLTDVARIGLGTPGTMDIPNGMLLEPHNLPGWEDYPIRDRLEAACQRTVTFTNDANAAAYGEYWKGTGESLGSMIFITLGTGIGGGIILCDVSGDGTRYELSIEGAHSAGAEAGHIVIDSSDTARLCPCGRPGHLEAYASARALAARMNEALDAGRQSTLSKHRHDDESEKPRHIADEAESGDALAEQLVIETAKYLGVGIATLLHVIDADGVVLGGAMTFGGESTKTGRKFLRQIKDQVKRLSLAPIADHLHLVFASRGPDAGYLGAAGLARVAHRRNATSADAD